jgi:hypothetical protein
VSTTNLLQSKFNVNQRAGAPICAENFCVDTGAPDTPDETWRLE